MKELLTRWKPPFQIEMLSEDVHGLTRKQWHIIVDGLHIPPPIKKFKEMQFPEPILKELNASGIVQPTAIQVQGLPVVLSGRDMIGIALKGSGNTLVYVLPLIMVALKEELTSVAPRKGPVGLIICPSIDRAQRTYNVVNQFLVPLSEDGYPELRAFLCKSLLLCNSSDPKWLAFEDEMKHVHIVVTTPLVLKFILAKGKMNLDDCRYVTFDELDRLEDLGLEGDLREICSLFKTHPQTVLFSASMRTEIQKFARTKLVKPVIVNVVRAEAANLDVIQEIEYVKYPKAEAKIGHLIKCLQKTPPPVLICCENKVDVVEIHDYLLSKGVEAVAMHEGKDEKESKNAILSFEKGEKDVLVAADVNLKGLNFPGIRHIINYDMPAEIEDYVRMIARTGKGKKTGMVSTFINDDINDKTLLNLRDLLRETKQRIPSSLVELTYRLQSR